MRTPSRDANVPKRGYLDTFGTAPTRPRDREHTGSGSAYRLLSRMTRSAFDRSALDGFYVCGSSLA